ncbi:GntR family transcriptional regulator [Frankia sp. Cas4]|uniref:GntR family transcriptional regulator n=1 Tax=Frankia sp. Cas4 TaxID=3073927 RepID=UPI003A0FF8A5
MSAEVEGQGPPFARIADHYRSLIETGVLAPGDRLPSIREMASTFDVARGTVANAISALESEGLVQTSNRSRAVVSVPNEALSDLAVVVELPDDMRVTSTEMLKVSGSLAHRLGIDDRSSVLVVRLRRISSG